MLSYQIFRVCSVLVCRCMWWGRCSEHHCACNVDDRPPRHSRLWWSFRPLLRCGRRGKSTERSYLRSPGDIPNADAAEMEEGFSERYEYMAWHTVLLHECKKTMCILIYVTHLSFCYFFLILVLKVLIKIWAHPLPAPLPEDALQPIGNTALTWLHAHY